MGVNKAFLLLLLAFVGIVSAYQITEVFSISFLDSIYDAEFFDVGDVVVGIVRFEEYTIITDFDDIDLLSIPSDIEIKATNSDDELCIFYSFERDSIGTSWKMRKVYPVVEDEDSGSVDFDVEEWLPFYNHSIDAFDMLLTENRDTVYGEDYGGAGGDEYRNYRRNYFTMEHTHSIANNCVYLPKNIEKSDNRGITILSRQANDHNSYVGWTRWYTSNRIICRIQISYDGNIGNVSILEEYVRYSEIYMSTIWSSYIESVILGNSSVSIDYARGIDYPVIRVLFLPDDFYDSIGLSGVIESFQIKVADYDVAYDTFPPMLMLGRFFPNRAEHGRIGLVLGETYFLHPDYETAHYFEDYDTSFDIKIKGFHDINGDGIDAIYGFWGNTIRFFHCFAGEGVNEPTNKPDNYDIQISPNPFNSSLRITASSEMQSIEIYDIAGRLIDRYSSVSSSDFIWDAPPDLEAGIYLLMINLESEKIVKKTYLIK